jgi:formyltetrahydrofolate deformylase
MKFLKLVHPLVGLVWLQIIHAYTPPFTRIVPCSRTLQAATSLLSTTKQPSTHEKDNNQDSKQSALSNLYSVSTADGAGANHDASAASASSATATAETSMTMTNTSPKHGILLVYGPDQKGIVAAFSQLLYGHGCGITSSEQSTDTSTNLFFQRICFDYSTMHTDRISLETGIREVCQRFRMQNRVDWCQRKKRVAIMVSKYDHCLWEILLRHQARELDCDISVIISNHPDLQHVADTFAIP